MKLKRVVAPAKAEALRLDLLKIEQAHGENRADVMLAVAAVLTGQLLAYQDQRIVTVEDGMSLIRENIAAGNRSVVDKLKPQNVRPC